MPCGGTETKVTVSSSDIFFSLKQHLFHDKCPPLLELTNLKDGKYFAQMIACGLGGQVEFDLTTKKWKENLPPTGGLAIVGGDKTRIATLGTLLDFGSSSTELNRTAAI